MIFLEKLFESRFREYIKNQGIVKRADIENAYRKTIEEWKRMPCQALGGDTPAEYLAKLYNNDKLADYIMEAFENKIKIGDITAEYAASLAPAQKLKLMKKVFLEGNDAARLFAVEILDSETDDLSTDFLIEVLLDCKNYDKAVIDVVFESFKDGRAGLDNKLLSATNNLNDTVDNRELKEMLLDILSAYGANRKVRELVTEGLLEGDDVMLYANLLGRCGDDESIEVLKEYAKSRKLSAEEYMEVRNAVERLGGDI
ncbi:MAG: hypothetical protein LBQ27_05800 [Clostridiales bacterium]|jgi:hypothetical protein|nr:hypothetical protein [Clostridiales bacterium]